MGYSYLYCPKTTDNFDDISLTKATFRKYSKDKRCSKTNPKLSSIYYMNLRLSPKLLAKVPMVQTTLVRKIIRYEWINPFTLRAAKTGLTILIIFF